jgi:hypothetical protein
MRSAQGGAAGTQAVVTGPQGAGAGAEVLVQVSSPSQVYRAFQAQRNVLNEQLSSAARLRERLVAQLDDPGQTASTRASLEKRIAGVDERIASLDKQIVESDAAVARAAAVPGATVPVPPPPRSGPPEEAFVLGGIFMFVVLLPMSIAYARRIWRRSARAEVTLPPEVSERMEHLERGMDAIALEVERIGEGQRFITQALTSRGEAVPVRALGAPGDGAAERGRER